VYTTHLIALLHHAHMYVGLLRRSKTGAVWHRKAQCQLLKWVFPCRQGGQSICASHGPDTVFLAFALPILHVSADTPATGQKAGRDSAHNRQAVGALGVKCNPRAAGMDGCSVAIMRTILRV